MSSTGTGSAWLFSRRVDLGLFGGSALLSFAFLGYGALLGSLGGEAPLWIWVLLVVGVDVAHVWATAYRTYFDREEFSRRAWLYSAIPSGCYVAGVMAHSISALTFWRILAYAAVFHFVRQQYGWVVLYRRKNGENEEALGTWTRRLDALVIYGATLTPLIWWHTHLPRKFHWFIAGDFAAGLPPWLAPISLWIFGAIFVVYAVKETGRFARGMGVSWGKNLVVVTTTAMWFLGIVVFDSDYAFTVSNVLIHGIPYFGIVLASVRQRALFQAESQKPATWAGVLSRSAFVFMVPLVLVAFLEEWGWDRFVWHENRLIFPGPDVSPGSLALSFLVPLLALPQATHYVLDAWIWKMRPVNREAATAIGLTTA